MLNGYSEAARDSVLKAQEIAIEHGSGGVSSAHIFLGILTQNSDSIEMLLILSGVPLEEARLYTQSALEITSPKTEEPKLNKNAKRVLEFATNEARRQRAPKVELEHLFIACVRHQRGPHVGEVLRPLGLDVAILREHLAGLNRSETPYRAGSPLNKLTASSKETIEAAHEAMRASFCSQISTAHLLLGLLADTENVAVETLLVTGVDIEELRRITRAQIVSDGQIATPQKKFSPASKRALERAKREADLCHHSFIGPQHLLFALFPKAATLQEKAAFGASPDDPLEKVWSALHPAQIEHKYEKLWRPNPASIKTRKQKIDWRGAIPGAFWWAWLWCGRFGSLMFTVGVGISLLLALWREENSNHVHRGKANGFSIGLAIGFFLLVITALFFPIF